MPAGDDFAEDLLDDFDCEEDSLLDSVTLIIISDGTLEPAWVAILLVNLDITSDFCLSDFPEDVEADLEGFRVLAACFAALLS